MSGPNTPRGGAASDPSTRRLESWKEIAAYLDRSPRTVRRWERDEGLPVHRHRHAKGSTVFAHVDELDAWLGSRVARSQASELPEAFRPDTPDEAPVPVELPAPPVSTPRAFRWVALSSGLALVMAAAALFLSLSGEDPVDPMDLWIRSIPVEQRLLLEASYFESRGHHEAALRALEGVAGIGPIGREAVLAAERSCAELGAPSRCAELVRRAADRSPEDPVLLAKAARATVETGGGVEAGLAYADRFHQAGASRAELDPELLAFVELLPARIAWLDGDVVRSAGELDRLATTVGELDPARLDAVARAAGWHCLALGRIGCAEDWFENLSDPAERYELAGYTLFAAGRMEEMAAHLAEGSGYQKPETAILLAMTGNPDQASELVARLSTESIDGGVLEVLRGGLDLIGGRPEQAGPKLASGVADVHPVGAGVHFIGLDMMSRIAEATGELDRAAELLEMTDDQREHAALLGSGLFWIKCQTRLAEVYRGMDRVEDAVRVERELLTALALSDPDHPTTAALKRRST